MKNRTISPMNFADWLQLIVLGLVWGGSFFFAEIALREMGPLTIVTCRVALAACALHTFALLTGINSLSGSKMWRKLGILAILNNVIPFSLIVWSQKHITGGHAAILNATTPIFAAVVAHVLTADETLTLRKILGVLCSFLGVVVVIGLKGIVLTSSTFWGQLAILAAACSYALAGVYGRRLRDVPSIVTAAGQVTCSTILIVPVALCLEQPWRSPMPGLQTWAAVAGIAVLSTALAYVIYFRLLARVGATNVLLVTYLAPVSAILLGWGILNEHLSTRQLMGMGVIALGLVIVDGRTLSYSRRWIGGRRTQDNQGVQWS